MARPIKPSAREIETQQLDPELIKQQGDAALDAALDQVKQGLTQKPEYTYRDGIEDAEHLEHIRILALNGTVLYDQDFEIEDAVKHQVDPDDN